MAHKKGLGSSKNGRDSESKRLGVKIFDGQEIKAGMIVVRQRAEWGRPAGVSARAGPGGGARVAAGGPPPGGGGGGDGGGCPSAGGGGFAGGGGGGSPPPPTGAPPPPPGGGGGGGRGTAGSP